MPYANFTPNDAGFCAEQKERCSSFGVRIGRVVDECRTAKGCIKKRIHGFVNGQPELSTAKEANVKNMEKSTMEKLKIRFHDETNDLDYVPVGDYYLPDLILDEQFRSVGYWGRRYRQHLLEYHPVRYQMCHNNS